MFANSLTAESYFHQGSSSVPQLHQLVVCLGKLVTKHGILVHLIHVSGTRMIAQGTDGCSHGFLMEGVMAGQDIFYFFGPGKVCSGARSSSSGLDPFLDLQGGS